MLNGMCGVCGLVLRAPFVLGRPTSGPEFEAARVALMVEFSAVVGEHMAAAHPANIRQVNDCAVLLAGMLAVLHVSIPAEWLPTLDEWKRQQMDAIQRVEFNEIGKHLHLTPVPVTPDETAHQAANFQTS